MIRIGRVVTVVAAVFMAAAWWCVPAYAMPEEYSAVMETTANGNTSSGKIYVKKDMQRMEMGGQAEGTVNIVRKDKGVVWVLMPEEEMYMQMPLTSKQSNPLTSGDKGEVSRVTVGEEEVDGHPCVKEQVTVTDDSGDITNMYEWSAQDLDGMAIKAEALDGSWSYAMRDIEPGPQDDSLFEIPDGYEKMDMGGMMMRGRRGYPSAPGRPSMPSPPDAPDAPSPW